MDIKIRMKEQLILHLLVRIIVIDMQLGSVRSQTLDSSSDL